MIFWSGLGFCVPLIGLAVLAGIEFAVESIAGDDQYYQDHVWPKFFGFLLLSAVFIPLGAYLNEQELVNLFRIDTMFDRLLDSDHTFFFIGVEYWGVLAWVLSVVICFL